MVKSMQLTYRDDDALAPLAASPNLGDAICKHQAIPINPTCGFQRSKTHYPEQVSHLLMSRRSYDASIQSNETLSGIIGCF